jgi:hypothetical protein
MTMSSQEKIPEPNIDSILKSLAEPYNQAISESLVEYESANEEIRNSDENRQRFEKEAEISKESAAAINLAIRDSLRSAEIGSKAAHKMRADRAGHLNDVEIYLSMAAEAKLSIASSELKASKAASDIDSLVKTVRAKAEVQLIDHLAEHLAEYRPLMLFLGITEEIAHSGDSQLYNARPDIHTPIEFALRQLSALTHKVFGNDAQNSYGTAEFLREIPSGIKQKILTPLHVKRLESEISAAEAEL